MKTLSCNVESLKDLRGKDLGIVECFGENDEENWLALKKSAKVRQQTINFLLKACNKFTFKKDTLFLAIKIADILLQHNFRPILQDYQLTSACLVLLTTKYNEVYPVTIDKISHILQKFYPRRKFFQVEGSILECLNFDIPMVTVYSELYNEVKGNIGGEKVGGGVGEDKENTRDNENVTPKTTSQKLLNPTTTSDNLSTRTLKVIQQPQCFRHGQLILINTVVTYIKNQQPIGNSAYIDKINYIRSLLKRIFESQKQERRKMSVSICVSMNQQQKLLNPERKFNRKQQQQLFALC